MTRIRTVVSMSAARVIENRSYGRVRKKPN